MARLLVERYDIDMELALKDSTHLYQAWKDAGVAE
jgi:hypothetical protein